MNAKESTLDSPIKVVIVYRVLQAWRVPVFERISADPNIHLHVLYGDDYEGSKLKNFLGYTGFAATKLRTLRFQIRTRNGVARIPIQLGLWRSLRRINPDVVITEGASHLAGNVTSYLYCRSHGKPLIQWGLGRLFGREPSKFRKIIDSVFFRYVERTSRAAIAYSSRGVAYYQGIGIHSDAVFLAVNTVDTEHRISEMKRYCAETELSYPSPVPPKFKVLFIGALTEGKKVDILLSAFALLSQKVLGAHLQIIGDGDDRARIEKHSKALGLEGQIDFVGHKSSGLAEYFYDASVMVLPGLGGLAISDALSHGVPVICSVGDGSEVDLINEHNGMIIADMTPFNLFTALHDLANDPKRQAFMRISALKIIENYYNIDTYVNSIIRAIYFAKTRRNL